MLDTSKKPRSFWKRPEGITGTVFLIGMIIVVVLFAGPLLAFITGLLKSMLTAIAFFVVVAVILYVLLDKKFRTLIWYLYQSMMRWLTGLFVQIDPIKILQTYIDYLYNNLKEMNDHIAKLRGQMTKLKSVIEANRKEMETNLRMAEQAKKQDKMEAVALNTRQFGRLKDANKRYEALLGKMEILYRVLSKIHKNSGFLVKDVENEVRMRQQEREAIRAGHSAMKRAMNIISGDPDKKMVFDMAMESIVDDVHTKIGEMERFIEISGSFIDSVDLNNAVYEQEGLAMLEKMEKDGMSFLLGDHNIDQVMPEEKTETVYEEPDSFSDYKDLFH